MGESDQRGGEQLPYLIVGQGLAGSAVAWKLRHRGRACLLVDRPVGETASRVAAGLINPLLGRKIRPDWRQEECLRAAESYYRETERELGGSWWQPCEIWRELADEEQQNCWQQRRNEADAAAHAGPLLPWMDGWQGQGTGRAAITYGASVLHAQALVDAQRAWLREQGLLIEGEVHPDDIQRINDQLLWQERPIAGVIWCNGFEMAEQLDLPYLSSRLSQGCILDLRIPDLSAPSAVIHFGHWLIRVGEDRYRLGASYDWVWDDPGSPSATAPHELIHEFTQRYDGYWEIERARAAVRPIIRHSQPVAGAIPGRKGHYLLGGLGSRGCTTTAWTSEQLVNHLLDGTPMPDDLRLDAMHLKWQRRTGEVKC